MTRIKLLLALAAMACCAIASSAATVPEASYDIIPRPQEVTLATGEKPFVIKSNTKIYFDDSCVASQAQFLSQYIEEATGLKLEVKSGNKKGGILVTLGYDITKDEGYELSVSKDGIVIQGADPAGAFYGVQTLRKSLPQGQFKKVELPAVTINDHPRLAYRGMMLDCCRHFFTVDEVKQFIDILALHNCNQFHWHLSEDQGWRIEIKKYPRLTQVGAWRTRNNITDTTVVETEGRYGGFYTQEQAREIVKYAAERFIKVIPEIDMPGHMTAALASYPNLGCTGGPYKVLDTWGVFPDVLCAGNDSTLTFIKDVLNEVMDIFPSAYINIGGDECPKLRWQSCPKCQARIKALGIVADEKHSAETKLQNFITNYALGVIQERGRRLIGWDEILEGNIAKDAIIISRHINRGAIPGAKQGHDVIMTPYTNCYFDYYQSQDKEKEPPAIGGYVPVDSVYACNPLPDVLTASEKKHVLGLQACLWTEFISTFSHVQYMILPRIDALCEAQWTMPEKRDFDNFKQRLPHMLRYYDARGWRYAKHILEQKQ